MGFYGKEPVNAAKTTATYLWTGVGTPGIFVIEVQGDAPNFSYGFSLVRDPHFVGGLKVDSMGWTGPVGVGAKPYTSKGAFPGLFQKEIIVSGSNGDFPIEVKEIPADQVDSFVKIQAEKVK